MPNVQFMGWSSLVFMYHETMIEGKYVEPRVELFDPENNGADEAAFAEMNPDTIYFYFEVKDSEWSASASGPQNYLVCQECGGAYDSITTATAHEFQDHREMVLSDEEHPSYSILPESEAF